MLDLKFLRENPDIVKQNIKNKFQDSKLPLVDEVIELDRLNRAAVQEADELRMERNRASKQIGGLMAKGDREGAEKLKKVVADGAPKEVFSRVEELKAVGLTVPHTTQLLWELRQEGCDVPLDALSDEECAHALYTLLKQ